MNRVSTKPGVIQGRQVKFHKSGAVYRTWRLPHDLRVPERLKGAAARIRHDDHEDAKRLNNQHLRVFPQGDPIYEELYGLRQDNESMNSHLKSRMPGARARSWSLPRQRIDMLSWQAVNNMQAARAFSERTGRPNPAVARRLVAASIP